jgi:hypothetical protein
MEGKFMVSRAIRRLWPINEVWVNENKMIIDQTGGYAVQHCDTVHNYCHMGTVVVILNAEYTGGELEMTHGRRSEVVTGPNNWVAMYGDCLHKIHPVTSGTRVSLIYDVYANGPDDTCADEESHPCDGEVEYHNPDEFWNPKSDMGIYAADKKS